MLLTHCGDREVEEQRTGEPVPQSPSVLKQALATNLVYPASADARVDVTSPSANFGGDTKLVADLSPRQESFLRFTVNALPGAVMRATLRVYASDGSSDGPRVFSTHGDWTESGVTWTNRPWALGDALDDKGAITGGWVEFDVTSAVRGAGEHNFLVEGTSNDGLDFHSREHGRTDLRPQLVITVSTGSECMPRTNTQFVDVEPYTDAYSSQSEPTRTFGREPVLLVDGSPRLESFLQFYVTIAQGWHLRGAKLRLYATDYTPDGPLLYRTTEDVSSAGPLWNNRPTPIGAPVGNLGAIDVNTWAEYDVTSTVTGAGSYSFGLLPESTNGVDFVSRDSLTSELRPTLRLTLESEPYCTYRGTGGGLTGWTRQYGGAGPERLQALASDATGGFVAAGHFGEASFPTGTGFALARYGADGTAVWSRQVTTGDVRVRALTLTSEGNVLVVGSYGGSPDLGTGPLPAAPASYDNRFFDAFFVAKFSPTGQPVWSHGFVASYDYGDGPEPLPVFVQAVATDGTGSLIVGGGFHGKLDLGGGTLFAGYSSVEFTGGDAVPGGFLAKFSWDGQHVWSKVFPTAPSIDATSVRTVAADASGNVLVGVEASRDDYLYYPANAPYPFIVKYDASGNELWRRVFTGTKGSIVDVSPVGTDGVAFVADLVLTFTFAGNTYTAGGGEPELPNGSDRSVYLGTLSGSGQDGWIRLLSRSTRSGANFRELVTGDDGTFSLTGFGDIMDLGGGFLGNPRPNSFGKYSPFVARYSASGGYLWARTFDSNLEGEVFWPETRLHVAPQPGGSLVLGSDFESPVLLDGRTHTSRGSVDLLYFQLKP
ncbi:DNRLRE domain-containing protein [Archangium violaceum]|uniref:CBM96 family carbohydrate-binding protein n=1 Tax=Archangium violaceum TaxID=83451 RepID=UPI0019503E2B|nr:DNRLRE domain-containing protein [Archangium violaceum]QRN95308.1 DNRLRE domain-containing protein [Archangium violaceum]